MNGTLLLLLLFGHRCDRKTIWLDELDNNRICKLCKPFLVSPVRVDYLCYFICSLIGFHLKTQLSFHSPFQRKRFQVIFVQTLHNECSRKTAKREKSLKGEKLLKLLCGKVFLNAETIHKYKKILISYSNI